MASTDWNSDDIDRIFEAVTAAVFNEGPIDDVISAIRSADAANEWPDVVLEDILDAEFISGD